MRVLLLNNRKRGGSNSRQQLERYHTVFSTRKDYIQDNASYDKEESLYHLEE